MPPLIFTTVIAVKPPIKESQKEDNATSLPKENIFHFIHTPYKIHPKEDNLPTKDKRLGPEHVHYSEVSLYSPENQGPHVNIFFAVLTSRIFGQ